MNNSKKQNNLVKARILTGDRPTGHLHLGHFVGTLQNRVKLQHSYDSFFIIADLHMLTTQPSLAKTSAIKNNARGMVLDYLSVGIDPKISTIYQQSKVLEVAYLALLFSMLVTVPRCQRVPTLKEVMHDLKIKKPSLGLLNYPVLQSADILMVKADLVPVGKDQESHLEITREIAKTFNKTYKTVFPVPKALIGDTGTLIGTDGQVKMSKSVGNTINLSDDFETVNQKVMAMYTDPSRIHPTDPGKVEGNPVFIYHRLFNSNKQEVLELEDRYKHGKVGDVEVKRKLAVAINNFLDPIRQQRAKYQNKTDLIDQIIEAGSKKTSSIARDTLNQTLQAMKML
ncbi:tryptophan--tRNA ligase [Candidatus Shapirobacteria bacterium]|nr:MAG: tryptophan--tRNA ligase [Candidatus Shapirobacteria bacterium]